MGSGKGLRFFPHGEWVPISGTWIWRVGLNTTPKHPLRAHYVQTMKEGPLGQRKEKKGWSWSLGVFGFVNRCKADNGAWSGWGNVSGISLLSHFLNPLPILREGQKDQQHLRIPFRRKGSPTLFASETIAPDWRKRKGGKWQTDIRKRESEDPCSPSAARDSCYFLALERQTTFFRKCLSIGLPDWSISSFSYPLP